ncbi:putative cystathionine beta-lyase [Helianthus debilis subsp. tardiflorus]
MVADTCLIEDVVDKDPNVSTILMNFGNEFDPYGAMSTPLYQTTTFKQVTFCSSFGHFCNNYYPYIILQLVDITLFVLFSLRRLSMVPTITLGVAILHETCLKRMTSETLLLKNSLMAKLDKADRALCFSSGMAALSTVTHFVNPGKAIVDGEDINGGSDRLLSQVIPKRGIVVKLVQNLNFLT